VERLLRGQIEILQAAGVDICDPDEELAGNEDAVMAEKWACSSETGYLGDYLHASTSNVEIDKQELLFDLTANPTTVELDLSFHGIARIPLQSASGEPAGYQKTEDLYTGEGSADWDGDYFYGSITMNRVETLYGRYEGAEDVVYDQTFDHAVFGGFSPELNQIHLCFDVHTREQFEGIKDQPFDQLLPNCATQNYFICTPEH
jgi:hypothetical protein